ncbi:MAG: LysM peptidoglycan-binding domain-containing protein [Betaproteobacteria bacterium]|nr:LysM peptidoglycan-binding domain-containing protein [Betaproteobacteria bacterium]
MTRFLIILIALFAAACSTQQPAPTVDRSTTQAPRPPAAATPAPGSAGTYVVKRGDTLYRIALENGQDYRDIAAWNNISNPASIREGQVLRVTPPGAPASQAGGPVVAQPVVTTPAVEARPLDAAPASSAADSAGLKREPRGGKEPYSDEAYARLNRTAEPARTAAAVDAGSEAKSPTPPVTPAPAAAPAEPKPEPAPAAAGPDDVVWAWPAAARLIAPFSESGNKGIDLAGKAGDPVLAAADGKVAYVGTGIRGLGELVIVKHNATFLSAYAHNRKILVKEGQQVTRGQKIAEMGNTDSDTVKLHFEIRRQGKPVDPMQFLPKR